MRIMIKFCNLLLDFLHFGRVLSRRTTAQPEDNIVTQVLVNGVEKRSRQQEIADKEPSVVDQNVLQQEVNCAAAHGVSVLSAAVYTPVCHTRARTLARSAPASRRTRKRIRFRRLSRPTTQAFAEIKMKNADKKNTKRMARKQMPSANSNTQKSTNLNLVINITIILY